MTLLEKKKQKTKCGDSLRFRRLPFLTLYGRAKMEDARMSDGFDECRNDQVN